MTAALKVLNDLSYVIECLAQDHTGEAKHQLSLLREHLSNDPDYVIFDKEKIAMQLQSARDDLVQSNKMDCAIRLCGISRFLWDSIEN